MPNVKISDGDRVIFWPFGTEHGNPRPAPPSRGSLASGEYVATYRALKNGLGATNNTIVKIRDECMGLVCTPGQYVRFLRVRAQNSGSNQMARLNTKYVTADKAQHALEYSRIMDVAGKAGLRNLWGSSFDSLNANVAEYGTRRLQRFRPSMVSCAVEYSIKLEVGDVFQTKTGTILRIKESTKLYGDTLKSWLELKPQKLPSEERSDED